MDILIFIYLALFLVLTWRKLDWAVLLILVALPSYQIRFSILGVPTTLLEAMVLFVFAVWFWKNYSQVFNNIKNSWQKKSGKIRYPFDIEIVLLLIISFGAVAVSGFSASALGIWKAYFLEPILFFIVFVNLFFNEERKIFFKKVLYSLGISALILSIVAIYQKITGQFIFNEFWAAAETRRVTSLFPYPNALGLYLAPLILLFFGYLMNLISDKKNVKEKVFFIIVILLSLIAIYFAKSEGALIGILAGLIFFALIHSPKFRLSIFIFLIISISGIAIYTPAREYAVDKVTLMDKSGQIRKAGWQETWEMLKDGRILAGAGLANYQQAIRPYHREGIFIKDPHDPDFQRKVLFDKEFHKKAWQPLEIYLYPHNIFLNFWVELGLAGMILLFWILIKYFKVGFGLINSKEISGKEKNIVLGLICAMIVIVVHGLVDVPFFKNDLAVLFLLFLALLGVMDKKIKIYATRKKSL